MGGSEDSAGICVILDHRDPKDNKDKHTLKELFEKVFRYEIKEIDIPIDFKNKDARRNKICNQLTHIAKNGVKDTHSALILVIFGECDPANISPDDYHETIISNNFHSDEYLECFKGDNCETMRNKPKIFIQHMWHKSNPDPRDSDIEDARVCKYPYHVQRSNISFKDDAVLQIFSRIIDEREKSNFANHDALFIQSLDKICRSFADKCDIIELFTKILRDVEISEAITKKTTTKEQATHNITFSNKLHDNFKFKLVHRKHFDYTNEGSAVAPANINPKALEPDNHASENQLFYLKPGQYIRLETYSEFELVKLSSMKIELKEQKLEDDIKMYPMDKSPRGYCIIINMSNDRLGSILDEMRMYQMFEELYFETFIINNRSHEEIESEVKRLAKSIKDDVQCLFIILMAHGGVAKENERYVKQGEKNASSENTDTKSESPKVYIFRDINQRNRSPNYIFTPFEGINCPALNGKPKVCVLQTCFGDGKMKGCGLFIGDIDNKENAGGSGTGACGLFHDNFPPGYDTSTDGGEDSASKAKVSVPHERSDWYKLHATVEGYKSYRTKDRGSYVIDALDKKFRKHAARSDISQLMTMVTGAVSEKGKQEKGKWQQPECRTYFNGSLYLNPGFTKQSYQPLPTSSTGSEVDVHTTLQGSICWTAGDQVVVASNTSARLSLYPLAEGQRDIDFDPVPELSIAVRGIISGFMLSKDKHIIIFTNDNGNREIAAIAFDEKRKKWNKIIDLSKTIVNPLTMCEINNDCFGVLRGTPNTQEDVTIEVYTRDAILKFMAGKSESADDQDNASTPIQAEYVIRVNYAKHGKINLRDRLCYSKTKFYISSFYQSTIHKVNVHGKIEDSKKELDSNPVALLRGPDGRIDVACGNAVYIDVFGDKKKVDLAESYASHMLNINGKAVVLKDPGLNHSSFLLIPNIRKKVPTFHDEIAICSSIRHQCIWTTQKSEVLALGSAESCHISLRSCIKEEPTTTGYMSELRYQAKIVQGIHLSDKTHMVLFDTATRNGNQKLLRLITMDPDANKIEMIDKSNTAEGKSGKDSLDDYISLKYPEAIFIIDAHTFGVVCKRTAKEVDIKIYDRETRALAKTVPMQQPCVGGNNDSACVDIHGEFYIANYKDHEIKHFDVNGLWIETIPTGIQGQRLAPYRLMVDDDNDLFILCQEAIYRLHRIQSTDRGFQWVEQVKLNPRQTWDVCFDGNKMYSVFEDKLYVYRLEEKMHGVNEA